MKGYDYGSPLRSRSYTCLDIRPESQSSTKFSLSPVIPRQRIHTLSRPRPVAAGPRSVFHLLTDVKQSFFGGTINH